MEFFFNYFLFLFFLKQKNFELWNNIIIKKYFNKKYNT